MEEYSLEAVVAEAAAEAAAQVGMDPNMVDTADAAETVKALAHPITLVVAMVIPMVAQAVMAVLTVKAEAVVLMDLLPKMENFGGDPPEMVQEEEEQDLLSLETLIR